jgi:hypothetical protein
MSNYHLNPRYRGGTRLVETPGRADSYEAVIPCHATMALPAPTALINQR